MSIATVPKSIWSVEVVPVVKENFPRSQTEGEEKILLVKLLLYLQSEGELGYPGQHELLWHLGGVAQSVVLERPGGPGQHVGDSAPCRCWRALWARNGVVVVEDGLVGAVHFAESLHRYRLQEVAWHEPKLVHEIHLLIIVRVVLEGTCTTTTSTGTSGLSKLTTLVLFGKRPRSRGSEALAEV